MCVNVWYVCVYSFACLLLCVYVAYGLPVCLLCVCGVYVCIRLLVCLLCVCGVYVVVYVVCMWLVSAFIINLLHVRHHPLPWRVRGTICAEAIGW